MMKHYRCSDLPSWSDLATWQVSLSFISRHRANVDIHASMGRQTDLLKVVLEPTDPPLPNLANFVPQDRPAVALGHLAGGLDHAAGAIAHEADELEGAHTAVLALAALNGQVLQEGLVDVELKARKSGALAGAAARRVARNVVEEILELRGLDALEQVLLLELAGLRGAALFVDVVVRVLIHVDIIVGPS